MRARRLGGIAAAVALLSVGCAERAATGAPPAQSTALVGSAAPPVAVDAASAPAPPEPEKAGWADAVRAGKWDVAAAQLDALAEEERNKPEIKYVRARAAIALGDAPRARELLSGLDASLPLLAADVARWRAEAALVAGPFEEAAAYFGKSTKAADLVRAAEALDRGGDVAGARRTADKAVAAAQRAKRAKDEALARALRARLSEKAGNRSAAAVDLKWIATKRPATAEGRAASSALEKLQQPLGAKDRMAALADIAPDANATEAVAELDALAAKPGLPKPVVLHARADLLFKARSWEAAAAAYREAASAHDGREAEALYGAARALARAEKDDEAIALYQDVAKRSPHSLWGERSTFYAARLLLQTGKFKEALDGYRKYQGTYPKGERRDDAEYEKALALLSSQNPKTARATMAQLERGAGREELAKLRELEGVAALRADDKDDAVAIWTELAKRQPLTYPAMMARARLAAVGAQVPPMIEPPPERMASPLDAKLPPVPSLLVSIGLDADAEAFLAQHEQEAAQPYAGRESEALCAMYGQMAAARRRYKVGSAAVGFEALMRAPSAAERWTWDCVYPRPYAATIRALEKEHGLPKGLVYALMRQESAFDPAIISPASAVGLMQIMPATAKSIASEIGLDPGVDLTQPDANLRLGAFYIGKLLKTFHGNVMLAAAAYNAGPKAVSHWLAVGGNLDADLFVARIPYDETRNYVARVAGNLARYQWLDGGDAAVQLLSLELPHDARAGENDY